MPLTLEVALPALAISIVLIGVQQALLVSELYILRRDLKVLLKVTAQLNYAVNPWAAENEPTTPGIRPRRTARWLTVVRQLARRKNKQRQPPE